jgi:hypothetical protein
MLSVIYMPFMPSVIMLSVVAPKNGLNFVIGKFFPACLIFVSKASCLIIVKGQGHH